MNPVQPRPTASADVPSNPVHPVYRDGVGVSGPAQPKSVDGVSTLEEFPSEPTHQCALCGHGTPDPGRGICPACDTNTRAAS